LTTVWFRRTLAFPGRERSEGGLSQLLLPLAECESEIKKSNINLNDRWWPSHGLLLPPNCPAKVQTLTTKSILECSLRPIFKTGDA
jgi:hypothetical protein